MFYGHHTHFFNAVLHVIGKCLGPYSIFAVINLGTMIFSSGSAHQIAESAFCAMLDHAVPTDWPMYELSAFLFFLGPMLVIGILYVRMGVTIRSRVIKFPGETKHLNSRTKPIIRMLGKLACIQ
jgi:hypothetical protein